MNLYRFLTNLSAPMIAFYLRRRRIKGREDKERFHERLGHASQSRPHGPLVWCHAASVGEAMSVLALIEKIKDSYPNWSILLTTGTVTSAKLMGERLPETVIHQYIPVDRWPYVTRFLKHWKPDLVLWVESELWPNMLCAMKERGIPALLINGRMSEKSYRRWRFLSGGAREIMSCFALGLAQTGVERGRFESLGLQDVRSIGNLKYAASPLPYNSEALAEMKTNTATRLTWLAAATHPGEEEITLRVHKTLKLHFPSLLTILVPRHPARTDEIEALLLSEGMHVARRSQIQQITNETDFYLADTMGEMGLFYRLCRVCFLAGSFTWGGHNPVEPAQLGSAIVLGPRMDNFIIMADDIIGASAAIQVTDEEELTKTIQLLLEHPEKAFRYAKTAQQWAESKRGILDDTLNVIAPFFAKAQRKET